MRTDKQRERNEPDIVYSHAIKAGRRIYYVDVKRDRNADLFICITESKRTSSETEETPTFEKHKVFLYKEDFGHFMAGLQDAVAYIKNELGDIEDRQERVSERPAAAEDEPEHTLEEQPKRKGLFGYFR